MEYWNVCEPLLNSPHTLIAGTTGSGKSVLLNSCLYSALPRGALFYFFDLKRVELAKYKRHIGTLAYVSEPEDVNPTLDGAINVMEARYKKMTGSKSSEEDIYIVIDELADLLSIKGSLERLVKIGRLGRACNIHLLCATQDPSRRTLKAELMQNFTCTVALRCRSAIESRQIIGVPGAEKLPLYGEAYRWDATGVHRFEVPFTDDCDIIGSLDKTQVKEPSRFWEITKRVLVFIAKEIYIIFLRLIDFLLDLILVFKLK